MKQKRESGSFGATIQSPKATLAKSFSSNMFQQFGKSKQKSQRMSTHAKETSKLASKSLISSPTDNDRTRYSMQPKDEVSLPNSIDSLVSIIGGIPDPNKDYKYSSNSQKQQIYSHKQMSSFCSSTKSSKLTNRLSANFESFKRTVQNQMQHCDKK